MPRRSSIVTVPVELPRDLVDDDVHVADELRVLWAIEQVRRKRCGVGRGAALARLPRAEFMRLLGEHGVPVIAYDPDDLAEELRGLDGP